LYVHMIWISTKPYKTHMEGINTYVNKYAYKYTYICICVFFRLSLHLGVYCSLEKSDVLQGLLLIRKQRLYFTAKIGLTS
jgi:hypothetical protein